MYFNTHLIQTFLLCKLSVIPAGHLWKQKGHGQNNMNILSTACLKREIAESKEMSCQFRKKQLSTEMGEPWLQINVIVLLKIKLPLLFFHGIRKIALEAGTVKIRILVNVESMVVLHLHNAIMKNVSLSDFTVKLGKSCSLHWSWSYMHPFKIFLKPLSTDTLKTKNDQNVSSEKQKYFSPRKCGLFVSVTNSWIYKFMYIYSLGLVTKVQNINTELFLLWDITKSQLTS